MFSVREKKLIAESVQNTLRDTKNCELPEGEITFRLHVCGATHMSWADIKNNGDVISPDINPHKEQSDAGVERLSSGLNTSVMSSVDDVVGSGEKKGEETIPCPFCGDKAEFTYDSVVDDEVKNKCNRILSSIGCWNPDCPIQPSLTGIEDEEEAIAIWNKRWGGFRDE